MGNIKKAFIVFVLLLVGCNNSKSLQKEDIIDKKLEVIIEDYIKTNPLKSYRTVGKTSEESGFSYPSYHLFFNKKKVDTILSIVLFPSYNNFAIDGTSIDTDETTYQSINHKGWTMYKKKYPLIIFDDMGYSSNLIEKDKLLSKIPDSLKANENNQHIKFIKWDYQIKNGNLIRIDN